MFGTIRKVMVVLAAIVGSVLLLTLVAVGLIMAGAPIGLPAILFGALGIGWVAYAYFRYKQARQDELLQVMTAALEAGLPLSPAIRAYVHDRPHEEEGGIWDALLLFLMPPAFLLWHQRQSFDTRATDVADLLEDGFSLPEALQSVRGVAPKEVRVAAEVGQSTGRVAVCLRRANRERLAGAWLEILPRLAYPLLLLFFITGIGGFLQIQIIPKMRKIFDDFGEPLPDMTSRFAMVFDFLRDSGRFVGTAVMFGLLLVAVLIASPEARWYLPVLGRLYRWDVQGLVLRMLGALLEAGRPAPEALQRLAEADEFPHVVRRCIDSAHRRVRAGEPLADSLRRAGLLPRSMVPLVQTAERLNNLPWALGEMGELLSGRAVRMARRVSLIFSPFLVIAVGALVACVAVGMFMPLIALLTRLSE
jgi:type II secretory pathway component PulF